MEELAYYKQLPYRLVIEKDPQSGLYLAGYPNITGCSAAGTTMEEAIRNAEAKKAEMLSDQEEHQERKPDAKFFATHEHDEIDRYMKDRLPLRVAAYIREAVPNNGLRSPIDLQRRLYTTAIDGHPEWKLAGIYIDKGSASQLKNRPGLQSLVKDCAAGKIDVVIVKNGSRLFRNVSDLTAFTDQLAAFDPPVGVYFEAEQIFTLPTDDLRG